MPWDQRSPACPTSDSPGVETPRLGDPDPPTSWPPGPLALCPSAPTPHPRAMPGTANPSGKGEDGQEQKHAGPPAQRHPSRDPRLGFGQKGEQSRPHPADPWLGMGGWGMHLPQQSHTQVEGRRPLFSPLPCPSGAGGHPGEGLPKTCSPSCSYSQKSAGRVGLAGVLLGAYPLQHGPLCLSGLGGEPWALFSRLPSQLSWNGLDGALLLGCTG